MTAKLPITLNGAQLRQLQATEALQLLASTTGNASMNCPHGAAPTSPSNGDFWTTTAGAFVRINGVTYNLLTAAGLVTSVFGRTGAVTAQSGDYSFSQISGNFTLSQFPTIADQTVLGNISGGTAVPAALSKTQLTALVNAFTRSVSGAVPAPGGSGTTRFLCEDASWVVPPGTGTIYMPLVSGDSTTGLQIVGNPDNEIVYVQVG